MSEQKTTEPVAWLAEGYGYKRVCLEKEAAEKLARGGSLMPLYASPPAPTSEGVDRTDLIKQIALVIDPECMDYDAEYRAERILALLPAPTAREEAIEEAAQTIEAYDRQPFPGFEAGVNLVKKDLAYRVRKLKFKGAAK